MINIALMMWNQVCQFSFLSHYFFLALTLDSRAMKAWLTIIKWGEAFGENVHNSNDKVMNNTECKESRAKLSPWTAQRWWYASELKEHHKRDKIKLELDRSLSNTEACSWNRNGGEVILGKLLLKTVLAFTQLKEGEPGSGRRATHISISQENFYV